ncbi:collagen binding domain-containing protein [Secundilactobacillus collinoides]|uniref:collagen binding domain-containing protein n=1 Tax=Secundilactobacillus collinoides TaxID=33960 RepID=UPI0006D07D6D|nr:collagen binding domain-containing protein [Secundilactobacillus collinoides]
MVQKKVLERDGNDVSWQAVLNAQGQNLENVTITDTLTGSQQLNVFSIKLYYAEVETIWDSQMNGFKMNKVVTGNPVDPEDYELSRESINGFTITMKELNQPIIIEYETVIGPGVTEPVGNKIEIDAKGYKDVNSNTAQISGEYVEETFPAVFEKLNGSDENNPFEGAKFKLQRSWNGGDWEDVPNYSEVVSNKNGFIHFERLDPAFDYRVVETQAGSDNKTDMEAYEFNRDTFFDENGKPKGSQVIKNWNVEKKPIYRLKS